MLQWYYCLYLGNIIIKTVLGTLKVLLVLLFISLGIHFLCIIAIRTPLANCLNAVFQETVSLNEDKSCEIK